MKTQYPRLQNLCGSYFHQDWTQEAKDWPEVIERFREAEAPAECNSVAAEIESLVANVKSDRELQDRLLIELGCYFTPRPDLGGPSIRSWLLSVAALLRRGPVSSREAHP
jgi:hypothetical protein